MCMCASVCLSVSVCLEKTIGNSSHYGKWFMVNGLPPLPTTHLPRFLRLSLRFRGCTSPDIFLRLHFYTNLPSKCQFSFASMMIFRTTLEMFLFYFPFPISSIFRFSSAISSVCVCVCCSSSKPNAISSAAISARNWTERRKAGAR